METTDSVFFVVLGWFFWTEFFTGWSFSVTGLGDGYFPVVSSLGVVVFSVWVCVMGWQGEEMCTYDLGEFRKFEWKSTENTGCFWGHSGEVDFSGWGWYLAVCDMLCTSRFEIMSVTDLRWDFLGDVKTSLVNMLCEKITWSGQVAKFSKGCKIRRWFIFSEEFMQLDFGCENYFLFPVTWYATCEKNLKSKICCGYVMRRKIRMKWFLG